MAKVYNNSIWSRRADGAPIKMGNLTVMQAQTLFVYTDDYLASGLPGLSLLASPKLLRDEPVTFETREGFPVHPRLMSIIPGDGRRNIQRRVFARMLEKQGKRTAPGFETDWEMALMAGANTIGHLFLFRDDIQAALWFERPASTPGAGGRSKFWAMLREDITRDHVAFDPDVIADYIGPTPTAGGMIPKLLVSIKDPGAGTWDGAIARPGAPGHIDVILKIEPAEYRDVLVLEKCCLDIHDQAGLAVPRRWFVEVDGMRILAVERFDRKPEGQVLPLETLRSVIATGNRGFLENNDVAMDDLPRYFDKLGQVCNLDVTVAKKTLFSRYLMAMLTGNGDMHLENISFSGGERDTALSPVYDPAPMRAWPQHDTPSAIPVLFRDGEHWPEALRRLGQAYAPGEWRHLMEEATDSTADYLDRLAELPVEAVRRERITRAVAWARAMIAAATAGGLGFSPARQAEQ